MGAEGIIGALRILVDADTAKAQRAIQALGGRAQVFGAAVGAAMGTAAIAGLKMGDAYDAALDGIRAKTGATGDELAKLEAATNSAAGRVTEDLGTVAEAVTALYQKTGAASDKTAESLVDLARLTETEYGSAFEKVTALYQNWNVAAEDHVAVNDMLLRAYQQSGVGIDALSEGLDKNGEILRGLGFSLGESTALIASLGQAGVDAAAVMGPLRKSLATLIKAGEEPTQAIQDLFDRIKSAPDDVAAGQLALETFGTKGVAMAGLIRSGRLDVEALYASIAEGGDTVQAASDDTRDWADGIRELTNRLTSAVGPITSAFAGLSDSLGNAVFLLPAVGGAIGKGLVKAAQSGPAKAGARLAGKLLGKGMAAALVIGEGIAGKIAKSGAWENAGKIAGSKFGKLFQLGAIAGLGLLIADQLAKLGEVRQANTEQVTKNATAMTEFLKTMPSRSEVEAKIASLKAIPEGLDGIQGAVYGFADFADGNILGSAVDGLFGANPAADLKAQVRELEGYLAGLGPEVAGSISASMKGAAPQIQASTTAAIVKPIRSSFTAATREVGKGFGSVADALKNPPKFHSIADRMKFQQRNLRRVMQQMRRAVAAGDPFAVRYWDRARAKVQGNIERLKGTTRIGMKDIRAEYKRAGISVEGTWAEIKQTTQTKSDQAQSAAVTSAQQTKAGIDAVNLYGSGVSLMTELASGIRAGIPQVSSASYAAANAAAGPIRAFSPPKEGPLSRIDEWGPKLVDAWVGPIERQTGRVGKVGARLAGAIAPRPQLAALSVAGGGALGGGGTIIHVGTLIANDSGIDELQRRMDRRGRMRRRGRQEPASPVRPFR